MDATERRTKGKGTWHAALVKGAVTQAMRLVSAGENWSMHAQTKLTPSPSTVSLRPSAHTGRIGSPAHVACAGQAAQTLVLSAYVPLRQHSPVFGLVPLNMRAGAADFGSI